MGSSLGTVSIRVAILRLAVTGPGLLGSKAEKGRRDEHKRWGAEEKGGAEEGGRPIPAMPPCPLFPLHPEPPWVNHHKSCCEHRRLLSPLTALESISSGLGM